MDVKKLTDKKALLEKHRPLPPALLENLQQWFRVELTYTSNALEGNTLTRQETALVVEKGITVGGKSLREHLEATNHVKALDWVYDRLQESPQRITEKDILHLHALILKGIDDDNAGYYRAVPVRISGSTVVRPNPRKVPDLMADFSQWFATLSPMHPVQAAVEAHYRLVTIHPFVDGNGRTARLLMNMMLMMGGYPPAIIRPQDRLAYITSLERAQTGGSQDPYVTLMYRAVDRSLDIYLKAVSGDAPLFGEKPERLLKIGALAQEVGETTSTLRHWTKEGLLDVADMTPSGYHLYDGSMVARIQKIQVLQEQRLTLSEIREKLKEG